MFTLDLPVRAPIWNAAGFLGFAPPKRGMVDLTSLGVFVTNPISLQGRTPAHGPRLLSFPGGILLHTGLPNPGLRAAFRQYAPQWARQALPVVAHLIGESPESVSRMVAQLEGVDGVMGIELRLPPEVPPAALGEWVEAGKGELPLIVQLPVDRVMHLAGQWGNIAPDGISFAPPRGSLPGSKGRAYVAGRLYGQGLFPQSLYAVRELDGVGIPIIAGGGVYEHIQAQALLDAGASAVQLDMRFWREPWPDEGWKNWLETKKGRTSEV